MADILDALIAEGFRELPRRGTLTPARPALKDESTFIRHVGWFNVTTCSCGNIFEELDGIYEERERAAAPERRASRHFVRVIPPPAHPTMAVRYNRKYRATHCAICTGAANWPVAEEHSSGAVMVTISSLEKV